MEQVKDNCNILKAAWLDTKLGVMLAVADDTALYLLEFLERRGLEQELGRLRNNAKAIIVPGNTAPLISISSELKAYFAGNLRTFTTPLHLSGSAFQQLVWRQLLRVPYGKTKSYLEQAVAINKPSASRAVANANGRNRLAIVVPCHRIINSNGEIGGYGGGIERKKWLLEHESRMRSHTNLPPSILPQLA